MGKPMSPVSGNYSQLIGLREQEANFNLHGMEQEFGNVLFDYARQARIGLPEAIFSESKPRHSLVALLERFCSGDPPILFTRLRPEAFSDLPPGLAAAYDYDPLSCTAWAAKLPKRAKGSVAVISGGTSDAPVAAEAARTLEYLGIQHALMEDCGVAALWRLAERLPELNSHDAVIVVAGMEGALACIAGGLCPKPIFAVPTSVGYGVARDGQAALAGMLACCAPGISVVNIDNGYGAACAAARIINLL